MKSQRNTRKYGLMTVGILLLFFILWMIWGNATIQISHLIIESEQLPEEFNAFKIAHISDLHNKDWGDRLIQPLQEENPELIVITGDLIDSQRIDLNVALEFIEEAKEIAPIYFVTGNQEAVSEDYPALKAGLLAQGVHILENQMASLHIGESEVLLIGLEDPLFMVDEHPVIEHPEIVYNDLQNLRNDFEGFTILLSHRPELFDLYTENNIDLVLSGHAHGGQFRIPFLGGVYAPDQGFFPEYTTGIYTEENTNMVVSRGLGNSVIPVRFNNRPELIFLELKNE